jgi:hypothetical protein
MMNLRSFYPYYNISRACRTPPIEVAGGGLLACPISSGRPIKNMSNIPNIDDLGPKIPSRVVINFIPAAQTHGVHHQTTIIRNSGLPSHRYFRYPQNTLYGRMELNLQVRKCVRDNSPRAECYLSNGASHLY